jgi:cell division protein FtsZ
LAEVNEASTIIQSAAHEDANIIFGAVLDEKMKDEVKITVIATGFKQVERKGRPISVSAAAIQQTRTLGERTRVASESESPRGIPVVRQAPPAAAPPAQPDPVPEETVSETKNSTKAAFGDDDLDVPAFLRKRSENQ